MHHATRLVAVAVQTDGKITNDVGGTDLQRRGVRDRSLLEGGQTGHAGIESHHQRAELFLVATHGTFGGDDRFRCDQFDVDAGVLDAMGRILNGALGSGHQMHRDVESLPVLTTRVE